MRETKFKSIYDDLLNSIERGIYTPGMLLPSLPNMAEKYSTSRPTIRKALQLLEKKGLVSSLNGIGVAVTDPSENKAKSKRPFVLITDIQTEENHFFNYAGCILNGLTRASEKYGFSLQLIRGSELKNLNLSLNPPDGMILHSIRNSLSIQQIKQLSSDSELPMILLNRIPENPKTGMLSVDYRKESRQAVSCMIRNGARRIALYKNPTDQETVLHLRVHGWRDAYLENHLPVPEELCITAGNYADANLKLSALLDRELPDMIFITNGACFYQVCAMLSKKNISIPNDIELLCFDDVGEIGKDLGIPINYIRMPLEQMGFDAAENMILHKNDPLHVPLLRKFIPAELVIRECKFLLSKKEI